MDSNLASKLALMPGNRLKFSWTTVFLLAAAGVGTLEVWATSIRTAGNFCAESLTITSHDCPTDAAPLESITVGTVCPSISSETVLVVGNPDLSIGTELTLTLRAVPTSARCDEQTNHTVTQVAHHAGGFPSIEGPSRHSRSTGTTGVHQPERVYFLPSQVQASPREEHHTAVTCRFARENQRVFVYVDQHVTLNEEIRRLIDEIMTASASAMIETVENLAGSPADIDQDGHLTIVITPEVGRLGNATSPVYGITRPGDFMIGMDRPEGNGSDVIFLNSCTPPGATLSAVLCHEWCHACVFSRQGGPAHHGGVDEDWLNEAIAHVVEVKSSGSNANVSHRIESYRAQPSRSPLVISDYCCREYWRHHGVRGAGYLFLDWYLKNTAEHSLSRLLSQPSLDLASLQTASHQSFDELFLAWTTNQGEQLGNEIRQQRRGSAPGPRLAHHRWVLSADQQTTLEIKVGATCADFVSIECADETAWQIVVTKPAQARVQATILTISDRE